MPALPLFLPHSRTRRRGESDLVGVELAARIGVRSISAAVSAMPRDLTLWKAAADRELVVFDHDVSRAGGYAENRYKRGLRLWRSRSRLILVFCFGPFLALGLAGVLVEGHVVAWMAGVVFGVGTGAWIAMRESPPAYVENWRTGAEGERKTARALRKLDHLRWLVTHDLQSGRGNYDHILVGAPGVILLETPWAAEVMEIPLGSLTYLFDGMPSMSGASSGDDRVVAVWGHSVAAQVPREKGRQAGFIPVPEKWSHVGMDRGHFVAHAAGGGMDMNFFPQAKGLNRGTTERGKVWKAMERQIVEYPGTPLFVRPLYDDGTWVPTLIEYGVLSNAQLWGERFENRD